MRRWLVGLGIELASALVAILLLGLLLAAHAWGQLWTNETAVIARGLATTTTAAPTTTSSSTSTTTSSSTSTSTSTSTTTTMLGGSTTQTVTSLLALGASDTTAFAVSSAADGDLCAVSAPAAVWATTGVTDVRCYVSSAGNVKVRVVCLAACAPPSATYKVTVVHP